MSEKLPPYPYPTAEHFEFPKAPHDQINDELRLYPTPAEFRDNLIALKRMYEHTTMFKSLMRYAQLAEEFQVTPRIEKSTKRINMNFFAGELLALHMNTAPAPKDLKSKMLRTDTLSEVYGDESKIESVKYWLGIWMADGENGWRDFFEAQASEFQVSVAAVSRRMFEDIPNHRERELDFMPGYMLSSSIAKVVFMENGVIPPS